MGWPAFILFALLSGSVPFGLIIARSRGLDIRKHGSGNIGATNVARVLGLKLGLLCFTLDVLKGLIPTLIAGGVMHLLHGSIVPRPIPRDQAWWWLAVVVACILGHMFSPFIGFKGGKGVATGLGGLLGLWPYLGVPALGALILWVIVAAIWRYVSLASCLAALSLPGWVFVSSRLAAVRADQGNGTAVPDMLPFYLVTIAMGVLVVIRHRANIGRLWAGTENRMGRGSRKAAASSGQ